MGSVEEIVCMDVCAVRMRYILTCLCVASKVSPNTEGITMKI